MGILRVDPPGGELRELSPVEQQVHRIVAFQMASLHDDVACPHAGNCTRRIAHVFRRRDRNPSERLRLGDVRCDHERQRQQPARKRFDCVLAKQAVSRSGNHYRVDHQVANVVPGDAVRDSLDDAGAGQHARLHGVGADVGHHGVDLRRDHVEVDLLHRGYAERVLRRHRGEHRSPVDAERGERF